MMDRVARVRRGVLRAFGVGAGLSISAANIAWAGGLGLGLIEWWGDHRPARWTPTGLEWPLAAVIASGLLSSLAGVAPAQSLWEMRQDGLMLIGLLFAYWGGAVAERERCLKWFVMASCAAAAAALLQAAAGIGTLPDGTVVGRTGWKAGLPDRLVRALTMPDFRAIGPRSHALTLAETLVVGVAGALALARAASGAARRRWLAAGAWLVAGAAATRSRTPLAAACAVVGAAAYLARPGARRVLIGLAAAGGVALLLSPWLLPRLDPRRGGDLMTSWVARAHIWRAGAAIWRDHPLLGVGVQAVDRVYARYRDPEIARTLDPVVWSALHNDVLQVGAERGLLGLLAWLSIPIIVLRRLWSRARSGEPLAAAALLAGFGLMVSGLTESVSNDDVLIMDGWFLLGLALGRPEEVAHA